jgi:8-oxo-dGTP diphosphatase
MNDAGGAPVYCSACGGRLPAAPPVACGSCGTVLWDDAKPCACALVVHDAKLLMVRRAQEPWKNRWDVPGGFCDVGEHPVETAKREVLEETGLVVEVTGFLGIWLDEYREPGRASKRTMNIYYHATPSAPVECTPQSTEVLETAFFSREEIPESIAFPGHVPSAIAAWRRATDAGMVAAGLFDRP